MRYTVRPNWCNCHPETCCCNDWAVYKGNEKITTFYARAKADEYVKELNDNETLRKQNAELKELVHKLKEQA